MDVVEAIARELRPTVCRCPLGRHFNSPPWRPVDRKGGRHRCRSTPTPLACPFTPLKVRNAADCCSALALGARTLPNALHSSNALHSRAWNVCMTVALTRLAVALTVCGFRAPIGRHDAQMR